MSRGRSSSGGSGSSGRGSDFGGHSRSGDHHRRSDHWGRRRGDYYLSGGNIGGGTMFIITLLVFIVLASLLAWGGISSMSVEWGKTDGIAISNDSGGEYFYTTYEYTVEGIEYTEESVVGWEEPEDIGKEVTVYYKLKNPEYMCDEERPTEVDTTSVIICFAFIPVVAIFPIAAGVQHFKNKN